MTHSFDLWRTVFIDSRMLASAVYHVSSKLMVSDSARMAALGLSLLGAAYAMQKKGRNQQCIERLEQRPAGN